MRKNVGIETEMFKELSKYVQIPFVDRIRLKMGIDPNSSIPDYNPTLITTDGGIIQLNVTVHKDAFGEMAAHKETCAKLAKEHPWCISTM